MAKRSFKCSKCDRSFMMAAHLARHMNTIHASPQEKAAAKRKAAAKKKGNVKKVKPVKKAKRKVAGRPTGIAARLKLRDLSIEQLTELMEAARAEARRKLAALRASIG